MADTYCGKSCDECKFKEQLNCPGCKAGPGAPYYGDCELARCCREKGHEDCTTCTDHLYCTTLKRKKHMPEERIEKLAAKAEADARNAERAPFLGKWFTILFWLIIPNIAASIMSSLADFIPILHLPGMILSIAVSVAYGAILLLLSRENDGYRIAGICYFAATALSVISDVFFADSIFIPIILSLLQLPLSIIYAYKEISSHAEVISGIDDELSEKWEKLFRLYVIALASMFGGLIIPIIGAFITIAAAIALIVLSIRKLIYLYRTAQAFREY